MFAVIKRILAVLRIQNVSWSRVFALLTHVEKAMQMSGLSLFKFKKINGEA